jgi:hypothetical protein
LSEPLETHEAQSVQSNHSSGQQDGEGGKKRKQCQVACVLGEYLEFKKDQSTMNLDDLKEKKRREEEFLVANCVDVLEAMDDLTDEQKADALELFKCDLNVRNRTLTLIEREDDTRSWGNFLVYFSHSTTMSYPPRG